MRPTHRLDVLWVPSDETLPITVAEALFDELLLASIVADNGAPAQHASRWALGGFTRVTVDRPGEIVLYANRVGGFHVRCPVSGDAIAAAFGPALTAWRIGGPRSFACPSCGRTHDLDAVNAAPAIAFGPWAVRTADVADPELTGWAVATAARHLGAFRTVLSRV